MIALSGSLLCACKWGYIQVKYLNIYIWFTLGCDHKGCLHMAALATLLYTQFADMYKICMVDRYNYSLLYATSSFLTKTKSKL